MLITKKRYKAEIIPMFIFPVSSIQVAQSYSFIVYSYALGAAGGGYGSFLTRVSQDSQI